MLALARSAGPLAFATTPAILAQNDFLRPASALVLGLGAGALRLLPVARLYLARPFAVNPAPLDTGSFSPRPTDSEVDLRGMLSKECGNDCVSCASSASCSRRGSVWGRSSPAPACSKSSCAARTANATCVGRSASSP